MTDKPKYRPRGKGKKPAMVLVHIRVPTAVRDLFNTFPHPTVKMREVLSKYATEDDEQANSSGQSPQGATTMTIANATDRTSIFIADRGFVWVCKGYEEDANGKWVHLINARCIRQWGTDGGLAQLINGPRKETALDAVAPILTLAYHAVIAIIPCDDSAWASHL